MAITEEQRAQRRRFIGSSDIAAIVGVDERRNAADVWLAKTGRIRDSNGNEATDRGIALEPYILNLFERRQGVTLERDIFIEFDDVCAANLDAAIISPASLTGHIEPVEAKSTNFGELWGEGGEIPAIVICQLQWQIMCADAKSGWACVLFPDFSRFKFDSFKIVRQDDLIKQMHLAAHEFMEYVHKDVQPPNTTPHIETLKRILREPETIITLDDEAAATWGVFESAKEALKLWEQKKDEQYARIVNMLGDNEAGRLPDGRLITYREQNSARHADFDALEAEAPETYKRVVRQGRHRVLRISKAKTFKKGKG